MRELELKEITEKEKIINDSKFKKVDLGDKLAYGSQIMQQIPEVMAAGTMAKAYTLKFPEGLHGELIKLRQGGYSSLSLQRTGRLSGRLPCFHYSHRQFCFPLSLFYLS